MRQVPFSRGESDENLDAMEPVYWPRVADHRSKVVDSSMRTALFPLAVAALIAGCGYKAPLYLPKPKPVAQKPAAPATTPAPTTSPARAASPTPATAAEPAAPKQEDPTRQ